MPLRHPVVRAWRPLASAALLVALAACNSITGGSGNAFATVQGTVMLQGGTPLANQTVAVVCPVIGRGQFGDSTTTDGAGGYSMSIDVSSTFIDDVKFANWKVPCDLYAPATNGRAPDTTVTIPFGDTKSSAPTTTVDFTSKP